MIKAGELFENAINHWRDKKGIGTAVIPNTLNDKVMVLGVLQRVYNKSPDCTCVILVSNFAERTELIEFFTHQDEEDNNAEFSNLIDRKLIRILTFDYCLNNEHYRRPILCVVYHPTNITDKLSDYIGTCKFRLVVINELMKAEDMTTIYKLAPILDDFKIHEVNMLRMSTPVKERRIPVTIYDEDTLEELRRYNEYIETSLNIFGSFDIMKKARIGDESLNISATSICATIAKENGWDVHLDMSSEFNRGIDELFNPANIKERASLTYEYIRNRSKLLSDYKGKLKAILDIILEHPNDKFLIISKRGDFAKLVTEYINNLSECNICGNYHDKVEPVPAVDMDGNPVYYKSGINKGERRMMMAKAQKTYNEAQFNNGKLSILSATSAPDKSLSIKVDGIIITSPQAGNIESLMYRLSNVTYNDNKVDLYNVFCRDTSEHKLLEQYNLTEHHTIVNDCETCVDTENLCDFVIAD